MTNDQIIRFNEHTKFLADIAKAILEGNKNVLDVNGVKEIIALYLMIPYMTPDTLTTPDEKCIIPKVAGDFCNGVRIEDLRNAVGHSFVTVEEDKNDGSLHGKVLIFDDRAMYQKRKDHADLGKHSSTTNIKIDYVHKRLLELLDEIEKQ